MDTIEYPKEFLRGISNKEFIQDGYVTHQAFQFDNQARIDNMLEASINWLDDEGAISVALNQKKENGKLQFSEGLAKLELEKVKLNLSIFSEDIFSYERAPIQDNQYHGNLLINSNAHKTVRQMIMNGLALSVKEIIPQEIH